MQDSTLLSSCCSYHFTSKLNEYHCCCCCITNIHLLNFMELLIAKDSSVCNMFRQCRDKRRIEKWGKKLSSPPIKGELKVNNTQVLPRAGSRHILVSVLHCSLYLHLCTGLFWEGVHCTPNQALRPFMIVWWLLDQTV